MSTKKLQKLRLATLLTSLTWALSSQALEVETSFQQEHLTQVQDAWKIYRTSFRGAHDGDATWHAGLHAEQEHRGQGRATRLTGELVTTLSPGKALGLSVGAGHGAPYAWRTSLNATLYQSIGKTYLESGIAYKRYVDGTTVTLTGLAHHPLASGLTGIVGLNLVKKSTGPSGWAVTTGTQYQFAGGCQAKAQVWSGRAIPEIQNGAAGGAEHTLLIGGACYLSDKSRVTAHLNRTVAGLQSRQGVYVGLAISF